MYTYYDENHYLQVIVHITVKAVLLGDDDRTSPMLPEKFNEYAKDETISLGFGQFDEHTPYERS